MKCFSELTYSMYADQELPAAEAREVEAHLAACSRCRSLVEGMKLENRFLMDTLQAMEAEPAVAAPGRNVGRSLLWTVGSAFLVVAVLEQGAAWMNRLAPGLAEWLTPFSRTSLTNLLFSGAVYLADEGGSMLHAFLTMLGVLMLTVAVVAGLILLARRRSLWVGLIASFLLVSAWPPPASALERRTGKEVTVPAGETVEGTLVAYGDSVKIDGTVNGDVIALTHRLLIRGEVKGNVVSFAQTAEVNGAVDGSVVGFAQILTLRGTVAHNVYVWVQTLEVQSQAQLQSDAVMGADVARFEGAAARDVILFAGTAELRGQVGRDLDVYTNSFTAEAPARIGGNLTAHVNHRENVQIDSGVSVGGKTEIKLKPKKPSDYTRPKYYFWLGVQLLAALILGLVLHKLSPRLFAARLKTAGAVGVRLGVGFLILVATPIAAVLAGITLIGLPLAVLGMFVWLTGLYLAKVFVGAMIGEGLLGAKPEGGRPFALTLLVGLVVVFVAWHLPYLGGWLYLAIILVGLGTAFHQLRRMRAGSAAAANLDSSQATGTS